MILAISFPCWLWPLLTGLGCGILAYLLGKSSEKEWKDKALKFEADLNTCKKNSVNFENDLNKLKEKNTKLEADLSASNAETSKLTSNKGGDEIEIWKKRVADLQDKLVTNKTKMNALENELKEVKKASSKKSEKTNIASDDKSTTNIVSSFSSETSVAFDAGAAKAVLGKKIKQDDLTVVEGIGPKIQGLFHDHGVKTWLALSKCSLEKCKEVLDSGGSRYRMHNPSTWAKQAGFAAQGKWEELKKWQDELDGGK